MHFPDPAAKKTTRTAPELPDIAWGAVEIGEVINRDPRATFHLLERGFLPARKVGKLWAASRRRLLAHAGE